MSSFSDSSENSSCFNGGNTFTQVSFSGLSISTVL